MLYHCLVVAAPAARGRSNETAEGVYYGKAPAAIVDLKAAVAYLHKNDNIMPGDANKIISNGTSAGGALSLLLGATGNESDYAPYLQEIGAAMREPIFMPYRRIVRLPILTMPIWPTNGHITVSMNTQVCRPLAVKWSHLILP